MDILNILWKTLHSVPDYSQHFAAELPKFLSHFIISSSSSASWRSAVALENGKDRKNKQNKFIIGSSQFICVASATVFNAVWHNSIPVVTTTFFV